MHIGLVGPCAIAPLAGRLGGAIPADGLGSRLLADLCLAYLRRGHRVSVFTADRALRRPGAWSGPGLRVHAVPWRPRALHRWRDAFAAERRRLAAAIAADPPAVLHAHWTCEFALAALGSRIPALVTAHDEPLQVLRHSLGSLRDAPYRAVRLLMTLRTLRRARTLSVVSPYLAGRYRQVLGYRGPLLTIPNGIGDDWFLARRGARAGAAPGFAAVINGWSTLKNTPALLRAWPMVRSAHPGATLTLFGDDHGPGSAASRCAAQVGAGDGIVFAGRVGAAELRERLAGGSDALVHPSLEEACPMALVEAAAIGLPCIGGAHAGGVPWVLGHGAGGLLVDVADPARIAEAMVRLAADPALRARLGEAGRALARRRFSVDAVAGRYLDALGRLAR